MRLAVTSGRSIVCMWLSRTGAVNCISRLSDRVVVTVLLQRSVEWENCSRYNHALGGLALEVKT